MDAVSQVPPHHDELSLTELVEVLLQNKWRIILFVAICTLAGGVASLLVSKKYDATIVVSPTSNNNENAQLAGLSSLLSQFGSLSSLAGLTSAGDSKRAESLTVLQSEALTERY